MTSSMVSPQNVNAREIPDYPGYWATDDGRIWSGRKGGAWKQHTVDSHGYEMVRFGQGRGKERAFLRVHRVIARAFLGSPEGRFVRHLNGDKRDNRVANLAYGTVHDNVQDEVRLGRVRPGTRSPTAKLNPEDVRQIVFAIAAGRRASDIAKGYGIDSSTVYRIEVGLAYKYISRAPFQLRKLDRRPRRRAASRFYVPE